MQKTNESIRRICIASIKRHTIKPINYPLTKIFESQSLSDIDEKISSTFSHQENELPIALTHFDNNNWTLLTTKKIISNINGDIKQALANNVAKRTWNDFKGYKEKPITLGHLTLDDNSTLDVLIETGKASMIIIYGIMTLTGQETSTEEQINKTLSRYQNRGFFDQPD
jgi:hypothetical protein